MRRWSTIKIVGKGWGSGGCSDGRFRQSPETPLNAFIGIGCQPQTLIRVHSGLPTYLRKMKFNIGLCSKQGKALDSSLPLTKT
jgi:hypothetical protein